MSEATIITTTGNEDDIRCNVSIWNTVRGNRTKINLNKTKVRIEAKKKHHIGYTNKRGTTRENA